MLIYSIPAPYRHKELQPAKILVGENVERK
jgi:hypothetical protein